MTKKARHISEDAPEKKENVEDWFSRFPDDILIHIISGLTLKEAARTCVLSSRWKYLWTFTTSLDFDKKVKYMSFPPDYQQSKYISWVNKVLELHRGSRINQFRICFRLDAKHKCNITNWVNTAIAKNVRNFELDLSPGTYDNYYEIPQECYKNLQSGCGLSGIKSLRSLTLCAVNVTGEVVEFFIHNCPLLENLRITQSPDLLSLKVVGSSIPLKCLDIQFCYSIKEIEISAPNLLSFKYSGQDINLHVGSLPQLVDVVFHVTPMVQKMHCIGSIVSYLPQLKTLELDGCNEVFAQFSQREFLKLMNLNISFTAANQETLLGLSFIMKACPFLEKLVLQIWNNGRRIGKKRHQISKHSHQHLKLVELQGFNGREIDFELAFYVFENATMLEKMIIKPSGSRKRTTLKNSTNMLKAKLPRGVKLTVGSCDF